MRSNRGERGDGKRQSSFGAVLRTQATLKRIVLPQALQIRRVELGHQEVDVFPVFGLEGVGDDADGVPVLPASQGNPVHLQDHLAHLQLAAVRGRPAPPRDRESGRQRRMNSGRERVRIILYRIKLYLSFFPQDRDGERIESSR